MNETDLFQEHFPAIESGQILDAIEHEGLVVSFVGMKGDSNVFAVRFATEGKTYLPIVMTETVAKMLRRVLSQEGF